MKLFTGVVEAHHGGFERRAEGRRRPIVGIFGNVIAADFERFFDVRSRRGEGSNFGFVGEAGDLLAAFGDVAAV